jgi:hypothetical protein
MYTVIDATQCVPADEARTPDDDVACVRRLAGDGIEHINVYIRDTVEVIFVVV